MRQSDESYQACKAVTECCNLKARFVDIKVIDGKVTEAKWGPTHLEEHPRTVEDLSKIDAQKIKTAIELAGIRSFASLADVSGRLRLAQPEHADFNIVFDSLMN